MFVVSLDGTAAHTLTNRLGAFDSAASPKDAAVAAVLTNQVVATYLPAIPGWIATQRMTARDLL